MKAKNTERTKGIVVRALFCAVAYLLMFVLRISGIGGFLTFDMKDAVIAVAAMIYGPLTGILISLIVALTEMITVSGTGFWGFLMNFISSAAFSAVASTIYNYVPKFKKKLSGAYIGLCSSIVITVCVMLLLNLIVTPIYMNVPAPVIVSKILPLLLPFNLIKTVLNASLVMLLYKPISTTLRRSGFLEAKERGTEMVLTKKTLIIFMVSAMIALICALLLILVLHGEFSFI